MDESFCVLSEYVFFNSVLVNNEVLNIWHEDQRDEIVLSLIKNCYEAF